MLLLLQYYFILYYILLLLLFTINYYYLFLFNNVSLKTKYILKNKKLKTNLKVKFVKDEKKNILISKLSLFNIIIINILCVLKCIKNGIY